MTLTLYRQYPSSAQVFSEVNLEHCQFRVMSLSLDGTGRRPSNALPLPEICDVLPTEKEPPF